MKFKADLTEYINTRIQRHTNYKHGRYRRCQDIFFDADDELNRHPDIIRPENDLFVSKLQSWLDNIHRPAMGKKIKRTSYSR